MKFFLLFLFAIVTTTAQNYEYSFYTGSLQEQEGIAISNAIRESYKSFSSVENNKVLSDLVNGNIFFIDQVSYKIVSGFLWTDKYIWQVGIDSTLVKNCIDVHNNPSFEMEWFFKVKNSKYQEEKNINWEQLTLQLELVIPIPFILEKIGNNQFCIKIAFIDKVFQEKLQRYFNSSILLFKLIASSQIGSGIEMSSELHKWNEAKSQGFEDKYSEELLNNGYRWFSGSETDYLIWLDDPYDLTSKNITEASYNYDADNINIAWDKDGTKNLKNLTQKHLQESLAIIHQNKVVIAPIIRSVISEGKVVIEGINGAEHLLITRISYNNFDKYVFELLQKHNNRTISKIIKYGIYVDIVEPLKMNKQWLEILQKKYKSVHCRNNENGLVNAIRIEINEEFIDTHIVKEQLEQILPHKNFKVDSLKTLYSPD